MALKDSIQHRIDENLARVESLKKIYVSIRGQGQGRRDASKADILRAAVVLLHASLEDFLRSLSRWKLPSEGTKQALDKIPFAGSGRPEKVLLGYLAGYRGKTVDELIGESVDSYLDRSNYNNVTQIFSALKVIGVEIDLPKPIYTYLNDMIKRRHLIVHRADRDDTGGYGKHRVKSISAGTVEIWTDAVRNFSSLVLAELKTEIWDSYERNT